ncbi:MAG TPA: hypothetical protein VFT22_09615 [Kofleriaceae bacterium]|nr:hypothetical protein [Kofleriaceae bacterium]
MPTRYRHVHRAHSHWPAPYAGVIATVLFGVLVAGFLIMLLLRG